MKQFQKPINTNNYNASINFLDFLNIVSIAFGFYNAYLNKQQIDNNAIMKELDKQDKEYFEKILAILEETKGNKHDDK